jgi:hypothetical protein
MNQKRKITLISVIFLLFTACKPNPLDVNVEGIVTELKFIRLDSIFVHVPKQDLFQTIQRQKFMQGEIIDYQLGYCLGVGKLEDSSTMTRVKAFVEDKYIARVEKRIQEKFQNLSSEKRKITSGFQHLKYHFPKGNQPQNIVFMNSFFASNVFCTENEIGIGLERYLGAETDVIQELPPQEIHQWVKEGMDANFLERDVLTAWIMTHYVPKENGNLATEMIRWGKIIYLTEATFPQVDKSVILRYNHEQLKWANENEFAFWKYLVDEKLLFSNQERDKTNFLNEAPFTIGLPEKGPDRMGQFLGWKMVHSYMAKYPKTKLIDLIQIPYNEILAEYQIHQN